MSESEANEAVAASSRTDDGQQVPFGQVVIDRGLAPQEEVDLAIQLQSQLASRGVFMRLGELLVARGVIDEETVGEVLSLQGTKILVCPQCMAQYNIVVFKRSKIYHCSRCQSELAKPDQISQVSVEDTLVHSDLEIDALDFSAGAQEFGNYRILGQISRGGMGIIYKARQKDLDRVVAMKVMTRSEANSPDAQASFNREARAVASLRHPHIVAIHEVGQLGGVDFYTMDYIEGLPLQQATTNEGLDQREVVEVFVKVCDAVHYSNTQGILHHDIKPQNILLDAKHEPMLIDFGISWKLDEVDESNQIVGSPAYLPPEYISGDHPYDVLGEVYALGATLYTVLAGRPPHDGIDTRRLLKAATHEPVTNLRSVRRTVDPELARIVMVALHRDARRRYATPRDFANDLRRWLEGDEVVAGQSPLLRAWSRVRGKVAATFGLVLALMLVTITSTYQFALSQEKKVGAGRVNQFERERQELHAQVVHARLENARLLLELGKGQVAEALLDRLLKQQKRPETGSKLLAQVYTLRAKVREQLGDTAGAADDLTAAAKLGG